MEPTSSPSSLKNSFDLEEIELDSNTAGNTATNNGVTTAAVGNPLSERIRNAAKRVQHGDYNGAIRLYNEVLKLDATNVIVFANRSAIYCRMGKYEKALQDAIKARELNPNWTKAYYRQGIALQFLRRYADALAAFASGLGLDTKSVQLLSAFVETAMKSPLRATLEPIYRQLQVMNFDKSPFVITSVVGQELLAASHYAAAVVVLESALRIGSCSLKLRGSVFSALGTAYWALNDLDQAIAYMQQDLQVAKSLGDILGECRAHANLGSAYFAKCSYKEALASHRYQLVLAMKHRHPEQASLALTSLGHVYSAIGDLKNALSSHQQCLQIVRQRGDSLAEAREIGNVGAVHLASGDFEKAIECHLEHVKLAKLLGNKIEEARAYSNLGSAYHFRRQYEQAIQFHEQVLRISQEIGDRAIESKAYAGLGHAARCMKDYIQAKRWYERQLDAALNTKDKSAEAKACSNLGIVYQLLGDSDGALKLHWSHLNICKQLNDQAGIGRAYGNIGVAYSALKQFEEAIKYHKMELQIAKEVHDRGAESSTHGNLALAYQSLDLYDEALTHFNLHLSLAKEINDLNSELNALCNLGNFHSWRKNYEKAIYYYEHYHRLTRCLGDKEAEAKASHFLGLANYYLKRYDQAMQYFNVDLSLSKQIQDRGAIARAYCHLGLANAALGQLDQALECQKFYLCMAQDDLKEKLKAMGYVAEILMQQGKHTDATKVLEKQLKLARSAGDTGSEANAYSLLGACQRLAGNYEKAAYYFKQESLVHRCVQDLVGEIHSLDNLGDCYLKANDAGSALNYFLQQLEKCELLNVQMESDQAAIEDYDSNSGYYGRRRKLIDTLIDYLENCQTVAKAYHNVANTKFRLNQFEEAVSYFEQEMQSFRQAIERSEQVNRFSHNGNVDRDHNSDYVIDPNPNPSSSSSSAECKFPAVVTAILDDLVARHINCSRSIGDCHFALRRYDEAIKYYLDFLSSSKSLVDQEQVYCLLGKCYQLMNNLTQALVSYEKRLVLAHELGCEQTKAMAYGELGHLHRLLGNYEQAITCFKHEQELGKDHSLKNRLEDETATAGGPDSNQNKKNRITIGLLIEAEALHGLGGVAQEMHDYERALKYHSSALTIAQEIDSPELESRAYGAIGNAYNALGNYESAVKYQEKHLSVAQIIGDYNAQVSALSSLGKINSSDGNYVHAVKYFQQALAIVERHNENIGYRDEEEARICYELGMALWAMNDLEVAETHLRRSVDLIESLHNLNSSISQLMIAPVIHSSCQIMLNTNHYGSTSGSSTNGSDASSTSSSHYGQFKWKNMMPLSSGTAQQPYHHYLHYQGASYEALIKILIALDRPTEALLIAERSRTRSFSQTKKGFRVFSITSIEQIVDMARSQNAAILYYSMTIDGSYNAWLITPTLVHFATLLKSDREKILMLIKNVQGSLFLQENLDQGRLANDHDHNGGDDGHGFERRSSSMHHLKRNHFLNSSNYSLSSLFSLASSVTSTSTANTSNSRPGTFSRSRHRSSNHYNANSFDSLSNAADPESTATAERNNNKVRRSVSHSRFLNKNWPGFSAATALYDILIGPFQNKLDEERDITQLLLVLDGDLFLVPWNMLKNHKEEFLSEKYSLLVIPSLHVLRGDQSTKMLRKTECQRTTTITSLVVANPTMPNRLAKTANASSPTPPPPPQRPLYFENPASSKEATLVSELLSTRPLIGTEANKEVVLAQLSTAQCIHFSSYIIDNTDGDPLKMATGLGIAISPSDVVIGDSAHQLHDHEYLLTPHDLISVGLSAKLVVISCPALSSRSNYQAAAVNATTTYGSSQVLKTITSALLQAGASCVLLTLWPVPLSALQILFRIFYCSLLQGTRVSTALKDAVSTIQNTSHFSHPRNWAGFILIGSDVRLSSQVALMSSSLAAMLKTPDKSRDAMRVVLHLVEKSLQRIQRGHKNAMYTTVQSIENKVGHNTQGWRELLISVGFRFEPASTNGLPACAFFPQSDHPNGRLLRCSTALQAILALSPATITAISKLIANSECVAEIIQKLNNVIQHSSSQSPAVAIETVSPPLSSYLETLNIKLWSTPGCHELYASLGFDLMEVGSDSVTLRAGKNANIRIIMFAFQTLQALFDKENNESHHHHGAEMDRNELLMLQQSPTEPKHRIVPKIKSATTGGDTCNGGYSRGEPDGQQNLTRILSSHTISETPCSRGGIGRNPIDAELIELQLNRTVDDDCFVKSASGRPIDLQSIASSQSSISTNNTIVMNNHHHGRSQRRSHMLANGSSKNQ